MPCFKKYDSGIYSMGIGVLRCLCGIARKRTIVNAAICKCFVNAIVPEGGIIRKLFRQISCSAPEKICDIAQNMGSGFPDRISGGLQKS